VNENFHLYSVESKLYFCQKSKPQMTLKILTGVSQCFKIIREKDTISPFKNSLIMYMDHLYCTFTILLIYNQCGTKPPTLESTQINKAKIHVIKTKGIR